MDLLTLISACALSVDPNIMHALIWEQSGGEPWSFSVPGEAMPRVLPTIRDAIREARTLLPEGGRIRAGLAGLSTDPRSVTAVLFTPCPNITLAARLRSRGSPSAATWRRGLTRSIARSRFTAARGIAQARGSRMPYERRSKRATPRTLTSRRMRIWTQATLRPRHQFLALLLR